MTTFVIVPNEATKRLFYDVLSTMYFNPSFVDISYVSTEKVDVFELL